MDKIELEKIMREFLDLSVKIKEMTKRKDKLKDQIKGCMGDDTLYLQAGNLAAVIVPTERKTLNAELIGQELESEGKEIPEHWWKITPCDRFTVKELATRRRQEDSSGELSEA
jgi:hypothetical protein